MVCIDQIFSWEQSRLDTPILSAKVANKLSEFTFFFFFHSISDKHRRALDIWFLDWIYIIF